MNEEHPNVFDFRDGRQVERWFYPEDREAWNRIFDAPPTSIPEA